LADRDRLSRSGADSGGVVRAAQRFSQFSNRPRGRRRLSRRKISRAARPAQGEMAKEPGLGTTERYLMRSCGQRGVRAKAGTHTPRPKDGAMTERPSATINIG